MALDDLESIDLSIDEENKIKEKSPTKLPLNPTAQGWTGSAIRRFLGSALMDNEGSILSNLKEKLLKIQTVFQQTDSKFVNIDTDILDIQALIDELRNQFNVTKFLVKPIENISKGKVVMYDSADSEKEVINVRKATVSTPDVLSKWKVLGISIEDIVSDDLGVVKGYGIVSDFDTSHLAANEMIYLDNENPGEITNTPDENSYKNIPLGVCVKSDDSDGSVFIKINATSDMGSEVYIQNTEPTSKTLNTVWIKTEEEGE